MGSAHIMDMDITWSPEGDRVNVFADEAARSPTFSARCVNAAAEITGVARKILRDLHGFDDRATSLDQLLTTQEAYVEDEAAVVEKAAKDPVLQRARRVAAQAEKVSQGGPYNPLDSPAVREVMGTSRQVRLTLEKTMDEVWASGALGSPDDEEDDLSPEGREGSKESSKAMSRRGSKVLQDIPGESSRPGSRGTDQYGLPRLEERLERVGRECITEAEVPRLQIAFKRFKIGGTNDLHKDSLPTVLGYLGHVMTMGEGLWELYAEVTRYDCIDFDEFYSFMEKYVVYEIQEFSRVFNEFDEDGSGEMDMYELRQLLAHLGITPLRAMFQEALEYVDQDQNGQLGFEEFMRFLVVYRHAEGFTTPEVVALRKAYCRLTVNDLLPADSLTDALVRVFGQQVEDEANFLTEELAKNAGEGDAEGLQFFEFLIFARRAREMQRGTLHSEYGPTPGSAPSGGLRREDTATEQFHAADTDASGTISQKELKAALVKMGYTPLRAPTKEVLNEVLGECTSKTELDFDQFFDFMLLYRRREGFLSSQINEFNVIFVRFDTDGEEEISAIELADIFRYLGYSPNMEEIHLYLAKVDVNGSGSLDFREFISLMAMHRKAEVDKAKQVFQSFTKDSKQSWLENKGDILSALVELDIEAPVELIKSVPKHGLDFDSFMDLKDFCREDFVRKQRKKAGFSDEEIEHFQETFDRYDRDKSGEIDNQELQKILKEFGWEPKTIKDQQALLGKLDQARVLAEEAGLENGTEAGSSDLMFWEFVQLSRILEKERDMAEIETMNKLMAELNFTAQEVDEFRVVFHDRTRPKSEEEESGQTPKKKGPALLSRDGLRRILRFVGAKITGTNAPELDAQMKKVENSDQMIDFNGFLRIMRWLLDSNFGGVNDGDPVSPAADKK